MADADLILASRSPQRRAILEQLGVPFRVVVPEVAELKEGEPRAVVLENARRKAAAVAERLAEPAPGGPGPHRAAPDGSAASGGVPDRPPRILAVDTEVVLDGSVLGKPADAGEAERFLRALSGREHEVLGGIVLDDRSAVAATAVRFRELTDADVRWYLESGEWRERAGGYAIQGRGAALVERVDGDPWNVVGLPVAALLQLDPGLLTA